MAAESKQENAIVVDHVKKHFKVFFGQGAEFQRAAAVPKAPAL